MDPIFHIEACVRCKRPTMPAFTANGDREYDCDRCHLIWLRTPDPAHITW